MAGPPLTSCRRRPLAALTVALLVLGACSDSPADGSSTTIATFEPAPGWNRLPDPPLEPRSGAHAIAAGNEVYVFGGSEYTCRAGDNCPLIGREFADGAAFDTEAGTWRAIADAPVPIPGADSAVIGDDIYVFFSTGDDDRTLLRYSTTDDAWTELTGLPKGLGIVIEGFGEQLMVYALAGMDGSDWLFDPSSAMWSEVPADDHPASQFRWVAATPAGLFLLSTGLDYAVTISRFNGVVWSTVSDGLRMGYLRGVIGSTAYFSPYEWTGAAGGLVDLATMTWTDVLPVPDEYSTTTTAVGLMTAEGLTMTGQSGPLWDARTGEWMTMTAVDDRDWPATASLGSQFFVFGGQDWSTVEDDDGTHTLEPLLDDAWLWVPPQD